MAKVSLRAYNREIEAMIDRGQFDEAIAHCRHILKTYPKHLETYRLLGKAYLESKRYGDAVDIFSRILTTVPNDFVAQVGMSIIRDEENNLDEAIWHMERAFETQPSNPAIQGELQRLYARRDGVRPPRIRMTRGALANMYVQGELYPQAISEINNVLKDDPERADMQALLARAYYRNGLKNDAADVATSLLRRHPYSLDANRVLVEILGTDHPESAQVYRQRVYELDPYAAHVAGTIFLAEEVSDAAVNVERLEWDGQPVSMQPDWRDTQAISLKSGEEADWVDKPLDDSSGFGGIQSAPSSIFGAPPPPQQPSSFGGIEAAPTPIFGSAPPPEQPPAQPEEEIPDFLRAAGWGAATGAFDESKSVFAEETNPAEQIEQGDLPDWVKAMKPPEPAAPAQQEEGELPDWIKNIGMGAIASQAFDKSEPAAEPQMTEAEATTQWLSGLEGTPAETSDEEPSDDFAWLENLGAPEAALSSPDAAEEPDWLRGLGESPAAPDETQAEDLDWIKNLGAPEEAAPTASQEEPDWLKGLGETQAAPAEAKAENADWIDKLGYEEKTAPPTAEEPDWLKGLGETQAAPAEAQADELDWLKNLGAPEEAHPAKEEQEPDWLRGLGEPESKPTGSSDELDWLKGLAVAGGAAAISQRGDDKSKEKEEPSSVPEPSSTEADFLSQLTEEPTLQTPQEPKPFDVDRLGISEQDQDDSFAWLESLAAKQGATEGLLTKPEDRLEEEPDWVKQAKGLKSETPASEQPGPVSQPEPAASLEDLGKSEQDLDDSFAWLESLAAKQGATEGLLTKPEDRLEEEPDWVKQAKDLSAPEIPQVPPQAEIETPVASGEFEPAAEQPAPVDDVDEVEAWLRNLEGETPTSEPEPSADETAIWLRGLEESETPQSEEPAATAADETGIWLRGLEEREAPLAEEPAETEGAADLPEWMKNIQEAPEEKPSAIFVEEAELSSTWMPPAEEPEPVAESKAEDTLPSWLNELDEEEEQITTPADSSDLPAWLLAEETAPGIPEPTIYSDWKPSEEPREETIAERQPEAEKVEPSEIPAVSMDMPEAETVLEPEPVPVMERPEPTPEPAPVRETGGVVIPTVDPVLAIARNELSRNNIPGALDSYGRLIKKARFLDEVIYDLREALYRYPVDVNLWQSLGDAYMRANRLQDALDAYTKAEELLR